MNPGLSIFKQSQIFKPVKRLQGGIGDVLSFPRRVPSPPGMSTWADYIAALSRSDSGTDRLDSLLDSIARTPPSKQPSEQGQGLQRGTENLEPGPLPPEKKLWGQKELAGLYDPGPGAPHDPGDVELTGDAAQDDFNERKTILNDYEAARASVRGLDELSPDEVDEVLNLHPKDWSDSVREKLGVAFNQGPQEHQRGTSNIMNIPAPRAMTPNPNAFASNPGLRLFMRRIMLGKQGPSPKLTGAQPMAPPGIGAAPRLNMMTPGGAPPQYQRGTLSAGERQALPRSDFALPGQGKGPKGAGSGSYPIPDASHARNALARVSQHGSPAQKAKVRAKVHAKYPNIG